MIKSESIDHWNVIEAGFRGSLLLNLGAIISVIASLANLGAELLGSGEVGPAQSIATISWVLFIIGLWFLAVGFVLVGTQKTMKKFSIVVGSFHALQGIYLLILLFTFTEPPIPPISMTVGRLVALLIFVFLERKFIPRQTRALLFWATSLQLTKASTRALELVPRFDAPLGPLIDTLFLMFLAAALMHLSQFVRSEENNWAKQIYESGHADFSDFNNPQHEWNKPTVSKKKKK